jgi:hypothetical protein
MKIYAAIAALLGWFTLSLQLVLMVQQSPAGAAAVAETIVNYFSFFTILTNLLVALVLSFSAWGSSTSRERFFSRASTQSATAAYIAIVCVTYSLLLRELWNTHGAQKLADVLLHDGMPAIYLLFWLLFARKSGLRWKDAVVWLIYPGVYLAYLLIRGALIGRYPYPFIDVTTLGYPRMLGNAALFVLVFLGVGLLVVAIGRWAGRRREISA